MQQENPATRAHKQPQSGCPVAGRVGTYELLTDAGRADAQRESEPTNESHVKELASAGAVGTHMTGVIAPGAIILH